MGENNRMSRMISNQLGSFSFNLPGPSTSGLMEVYRSSRPQTTFEDIPDVEAYENTTITSRSDVHNISNDYSTLPVHHHDVPPQHNVLYDQRMRQQITPKVEVNENNSPLTSPSATVSTGRILQRSGIKMEIPPYLDPDSTDDDPEDGVVYPEPDLFDVKNTNMTEYDLEILKYGKQTVDEARNKIDLPDASAPPNKIVEYLMFYRTLKESELVQLNAYRTKRNRLSLNLVKNNIDREFDQKACESLVKKLKDKKTDLQNLIDVVISNGANYLGCITIPRTLDGRLQVHGRKGFPHVVYGKLWRFSEMTKNETRHVDHCKHAFEMKSDLVCVNPYHYEIVVGAMIVGSHEHRDMPSSQNIPPRYPSSSSGRRHSIEEIPRNHYIPVLHPPMNIHSHNMSNTIMPSSLTANISSMFPSMSTNIPSSMSSNVHSSFPMAIGIPIDHAPTQHMNQGGQTVGQHLNTQLNPNLNPLLAQPMNSIDPSLVSTMNQPHGQQFHQSLESCGRPVFGATVGCSLEPTIDSSLSALVTMGPPGFPLSHSMGLPIDPSVVPPMVSSMHFPLEQFNQHSAHHTVSSIGQNFQQSQHIDFSKLPKIAGPSMTTTPNYNIIDSEHPDNNSTSFSLLNNSQNIDQSDTKETVYAFSEHKPTQNSIESSEPQATLTAQPFVTVNVFRKFCNKVFGSRFFDEIDKNDISTILPKTVDGIQYVETTRTPLLGVIETRRRLNEGDEIMGPLPETAPYNDLCNFVVKLTAQMIVLKDEEPDSKIATDRWGTIVYYEGENRIGEKKCNQSDFVVDGGYVFADNRFSLGLESNPHRTQSASKVRQAIIRGIRISYKGDGSIWLQNNMKWPVFVTSGYLDEQCGGMETDKVHKVYGFAKLKVFGYHIVKDVIRDSIFSKQMVSLHLRGRITPMGKIYRSVDDELINQEAGVTPDSLQRFCCVRVSFCKGFGKSYKERPSISDCPVWIELKVNVAYDYMDSILTDLGNTFKPLEIEAFQKLGLDVSED